MPTPNILSKVNEFLAERQPTLPTIFQDVFPYTAIDEIMCREEPSTAVETRYLDGTRIGGFNFTYYSKADEIPTARDRLYTIIDTLDLEESEIDSGISITITAITSPNFIQKTEAGEYIFSAAFKLDYLNRRI